MDEMGEYKCMEDEEEEEDTGNPTEEDEGVIDDILLIKVRAGQTQNFLKVVTEKKEQVMQSNIRKVLNDALGKKGDYEVVNEEDEDPEALIENIKSKREGRTLLYARKSGGEEVKVDENDNARQYIKPMETESSLYVDTLDLKVMKGERGAALSSYL